MKSMFISLVAMTYLAQPAYATVYEWTDDLGAVHYTDDAQRVPPAFRKVMKVRPEDTKVTNPVSLPPVPTASPPGVTDPGGRSERSWRQSFTGLRTEIRTSEARIKEKRERLDALRRQMVRFHRGSDRRAYNDLSGTIQVDEAQLKELKDGMMTLEAEADRAGVPNDWRDFR